MTKTTSDLLSLAADFARAGDTDACAQHVQAQADALFPLDRGDPVWGNVANNAFQRAAYALFDLNSCPEYEWPWTDATPHNCQWVFSTLSTSVVMNSSSVRSVRVGPRAVPKEHDYTLFRATVEIEGFLWGGDYQRDLMTLYSTAITLRPTGTAQVLGARAYAFQRAVAGSDRMRASVKDIALEAMATLCDPTLTPLAAHPVGWSRDQLLLAVASAVARSASAESPAS